MNNKIANLPVRVLCLFTLLDRGGAETMCMNVYRNIDRTRVQFDFLVYYPQRGEYEDEIESLGGKIYRIPHLDPKNLGAHIKGARDFFLFHPEYQIVHNHMGENGALICMEAKRAHVSTIIFHSHVDAVPIVRKQISENKTNIIFDKKQAKLCLLYPFAMYSATDYFACGDNAAKVFRYKRQKAIIINNGIDIKRFAYDEEVRIRKRSELNCNGLFIIGNVARLNDNKNQSFALDIMVEFMKIHPSSQMWFVGDGDKRDYLIKKAKKLGIHEHIRFLGVRNDVHELLQAMDIFLFPSKKEGLPVSCIEAQASGLPCVFNNGFDPKTAITKNCKLLPLSEHPTKWAKVIQGYLNYTRIDTSDQIKAAGYDIKVTAKWLEKFYLSHSR